MSVLVRINIASRHVHGIVRQPLILSVPLLVIQAKKKFVIFRARNMQIPRTLTILAHEWSAAFSFLTSSGCNCDRAAPPSSPASPIPCA